MDFPYLQGGLAPVATINPWSGLYSTVPSRGSVAPANGTMTANRSLFFPFILQNPVVCKKAYVHNGVTINGNFDVGIYDKAGVRLFSLGSTAQSGADVLQIIDITDFIIGPDLFYLAFSQNSSTGTYFRSQTATFSTDLRLCGVVQEGVFPLPAQATFVALADSRIPNFGFAIANFL